MKVALQGFRAASVASMEHFSALETTASGGVLQRTIPHLPGSGTCSIAVTVQAGATAIRVVVFLCVVSGIEIDYLAICIYPAYGGVEFLLI